MDTTQQDNYYIPEPSKWPIITVIGLFVLLFGLVLFINDVAIGSYAMIVGGLVMAYLLFGWFGEVISENESGVYNEKVDRSFRQGMFWFITSEAFFFITFFGCLYYLREISLPWLGGEGNLAKSGMLWEGFQATWPLVKLPDATNYAEMDAAMGPWGIPAWNTVILLTSGLTVTWAHWGLKKDNRQQLIVGLFLTVLLGLVFFALQAYEYGHAYSDLKLTLNSGIYGSTFYMLTGFHGLHVCIGTIMLIAILARSMKGHFTAKNHFAFEGVAWYWHFVDVVWLGLFVFVYWL